MKTNAPKVIGKYDIVARIARGGMAAIYLARQPGIGGFSRRVVLKVILPALAADPKFVQMFMEEARVASLVHHPNVVQIFDVGKDDDTYFIAMEFIDGLTVGNILNDLHGESRALPIPIAGEIIAQACSGLHAAHKLVGEDGEPLNIVHRDVSPQNLMVSRDGVVKLVDFGIAKAHDSAIRTGTGMVKGKFAYMSPEQVRAISLDRRSDLFSLGAVFYELLTGSKLFQRDNELATMQAIITEPIPKPHDKDPTIPEPLSEVIARALRRDRSERFETAAEMGTAVRKVLGELGHYTSAETIAEFIESECVEHLHARKVERLELLTPRSGAPEVPDIVDLAPLGDGGMADALRGGDSARESLSFSNDVVLGTVEAQLAEVAEAMRPRDDDGWAETVPGAPTPKIASGQLAPPVEPLAPTEPPGPLPSGTTARGQPTGADDAADARAPAADLSPRGAGARDVSGSRPLDGGPARPAKRPELSPPPAGDLPPPRPAIAARPAPATGVASASGGGDATRASSSDASAAKLTRRLILGVLFGAFAGVALAFSLGLRPSCGAPDLPPLRWAHPPSVSRAELERGLGPVASYLKGAVGRRVTLVRTETYADSVELLLRGDVELATLSPALLVEARRRAETLPVLAAFGGAGAETEHSYIITREDSEIRAIEQLEGRRFCAPDPRSTTGYLLPRQLLRARGLSPSTFFAATSFSAGQVGVLEDVLSGRCDVGAVSATTWNGARALGIRAEGLRLVSDAGEAPRDVVVAAPGLEGHLTRAVRDALLAFDAGRHYDTDDPSPLFVIDRFTAPRLEDFAAVERAMRADERERAASP